MKIFRQNKKEMRKGFTLVETLVAISIFTLSILTMMTVLGNGLSNTGYAKKKMIASYLAQEGIEYMQNLRDTYALFTPGGGGWTAFETKLTQASCASSSGCYFDTGNVNYASGARPIISATLAGCTAKNAAAVCPNHPILFNPASGVYGYTAGTNSGYGRSVTVTALSADEIRVSSTVSWLQGTQVFSITLSENLTNWIE